jgi:hypothetical protein
VRAVAEHVHTIHALEHDLLQVKHQSNTRIADLEHQIEQLKGLFFFLTMPRTALLGWINVVTLCC